MEKQFMTMQGTSAAASAANNDGKQSLSNQFGAMSLKSGVDTDQESAMMSKSLQSSQASFSDTESKEHIIPGNKPLGAVEVKISDLKFYEMLGQGASGCVKKVVHKPTKKYLALKEIAYKQDN